MPIPLQVWLLQNHTSVTMPACHTACCAALCSAASCVCARLPTLYLCECVLIYLEPGEAEAVLAAAAAMAAEGGAAAAVAIYEQTRPDDAFGSTMISNLEVRLRQSVTHI